MVNTKTDPILRQFFNSAFPLEGKICPINQGVQICHRGIKLCKQAISAQSGYQRFRTTSLACSAQYQFDRRNIDIHTAEHCRNLKHADGQLFLFFFPLKFHPFATMRKIKNKLRRTCFFCFISFYHFFTCFFFVYLKLIFGLSVLALTKETKNLKLKATKFKHLTQS